MLSFFFAHENSWAMGERLHRTVFFLAVPSAPHDLGHPKDGLAHIRCPLNMSNFCHSCVVFTIAASCYRAILHHHSHGVQFMVYWTRWSNMIKNLWCISAISILHIITNSLCYNFVLILVDFLYLMDLHLSSLIIVNYNLVWEWWTQAWCHDGLEWGSMDDQSVMVVSESVMGDNLSPISRNTQDLTFL